MHNPLEQYLEDLSDSLKSLPAEEREAEIREVRQHLEILVIQRMEHGESLDEAIRAAIRQFGSPVANGQDLSWAWRRKHNRAKRQTFKKHILVMVGTRQGRPVIHWPGVITTSVLVVTICAISAVATLFLLGQSFFLLPRTFATGIPIQLVTMVGVNIVRGLKTPPDQLRALD